MFKRTDVQPYLSVTLCSNPNDQQCRMQLHPHLRAGYQSYRDRINENIRPISCEMTGTYCGRSRHRLPRREGARSAGRTGGAPQYVPADMYPPATVFLRKRSRCLFPPSTCHGIPAKAFQVGDFVRCPILPPTCHSVPADVLAVNGSRQAVTWTMLPPFRPEEGSMKLCRGSPGFPCQSNRSAISAASILPARSSGTKDHRPTTSGALIAAGSILPCSVR